MLSKLYDSGIQGASHVLLEHYFANRYKYVEIDGVKSAMKPIGYGLPLDGQLSEF